MFCGDFNEEESLLKFLYGYDIGAGMGWFQYGGLSTLLSYGVTVKGIPTVSHFESLRAEFSAKLPESHLIFFQNLKLSFSHGSYFFTHAGIKPKVKLTAQQAQDLLWIRDEFLESKRDHGAIIVHGHTVTETPQILTNRIGLDTGAYSSGILSCGVFEAETFRILQTNS